MTDKNCNVRVAVRVRPSNKEELALNSSTIITFPRDNELKIYLNNDNITTMNLDREKRFTFDKTFGMKSEQIDIYNSIVKNDVESFMQGFNATIFAYGQTGSGKTYTILGNTGENELGILPRAIKQIFEHTKTNKNDYDYELKVSFIEIYKEKIKDLLNDNIDNKSQPFIRENNKGEISVDGAEEILVYNENDMIECLAKGVECRSTGSTKMNETSSRSHAIYTIFLTRTKKKNTILEQSQVELEGEIEENDTDKSNKVDFDEIISSKFHFVDLAGSERLKKTLAEGDRMKEGISINKGLLALGNVISKLSSSQYKNGSFVNFRDSKITRLLQDSLGGNSKTLMIACISPSELSQEETYNTLQYANRARKIKNKPVKNCELESGLIGLYKSRIIKLEQQIEQLQHINLNKNENNNLKHKLKLAEDQIKQLNNQLNKSTKQQCHDQAMLAKVYTLLNDKENTSNTSILDNINNIIHQNHNNNDDDDVINNFKSNDDILEENIMLNRYIDQCISLIQKYDSCINHNQLHDIEWYNKTNLDDIFTNNINIEQYQANLLIQQHNKEIIKDQQILKELESKQILIKKQFDQKYNDQIIELNLQLKQKEQELLILNKQKNNDIKSLKLKNTINQMKDKLKDYHKKIIDNQKFKRQYEAGEKQINKLNKSIELQKSKIIQIQQKSSNRLLTHKAWQKRMKNSLLYEKKNYKKS